MKTINDGVRGKIRELVESLADIENGSPKGVYATLPALQSSLPTGAVGAFVVAADGKWYYWNSTAWTAGGIYQATGIADGSVATVKTNFFHISKNLFNVKGSFYEGYVSNSGATEVFNPSSQYKTTDYLAVKPNTIYAFPFVDLLITDGVTGPVFEVMSYDSNKVPLGFAYQSEHTGYRTITSGSTTEYVKIIFKGCFATPANAGLYPYFTNFIFNEGATVATFEKYGDTLRPEYFTVNLNQIVKDFIVVSKNGKGDFTTISAAVAVASEGAVILVMPGSYEEVVRAQNKDISIIGVDKTRCILWNSTGDYNNCPLYINKGHIKNLTIKAIYSASVNYTGLSSYAYAIHIDDYGDYGTLLIEDCDLLSDFSSVFGCGARNGHKLIIRNCNAEGTNLSGLDIAHGFAYHSSAGCDATITFDNSRFKSAIGNDINFTSAGDGTVYVTAYYNIASNVVDLPYFNTVFFLTSDNYGNQSDKLNSAQ